MSGNSISSPFLAKNRAFSPMPSSLSSTPATWPCNCWQYCYSQPGIPWRCSTLLSNIDFFYFVVTNIIRQFDNDAFRKLTARHFQSISCIRRAYKLLGRLYPNLITRRSNVPIMSTYYHLFRYLSPLVENIPSNLMVEH